MKTPLNPEYSIAKLDKTHPRKTFSCGIPSLDNYIHTLAGQDSRKNLSVTYALIHHEANALVGYYTLSSASIELGELSEALISKLPQYPRIPATLIGRLAIDLNYQKQGLGEVFLMDALQRSCRASQEIASFAVMVDAINESANMFYKKYGFLPISSEKNKNKSRLYLPMDAIKKL